MDINKELNTIKFQILTDSKDNFIAGILCQLDIKFTNKLPSAGTNGKELLINPDFFRELPSTECRRALLLHEVWHIARMHSFRRGTRKKKEWNIVCDIVINNALYEQGYDIKAMHGVFEKKLQGKSEEEIYDAIQVPEALEYPYEDLETSGDKTQLGIVTAALQTAKVVPGSETHKIQQMLDGFLKPKVDWRRYLRKYFTNIGEPVEQTWNRPNRRYSDIYLPSMKDTNGLEHLAYFIDTSGSLEDEEIKIINSEIRGIKNICNPKLMTVCQFDTKIHKESVFKDDQPYNTLNIVGRGGTDFRCIAEYLQKHKVTCAVIFTDCYAKPVMLNIPVIWVCTKKDLPDKYKPICGKTLYME